MTIKKSSIIRKKCRKHQCFEGIYNYNHRHVSENLGYKEPMQIIYIDLLLMSGVIIFYGLLFRYLAQSKFTEPIAQLVNNPSALLSFTVLICTLAGMRYCTCADRKKQYMYGVVSAIGYVILFINQNMMSFFCMTIMFLLMPIIFTPTAELMKCFMQLLFGFYFMLSNMALLTNYTALLTVDVSYNLEASVYIDLVLAVVLFIFLNYWEKLPKEQDFTKLKLYRMQKVVKYALGVFILLYIVLVTIKGQILAVEADNMVVSFLKVLDEQLLSVEGTYMQVYTQYGICGMLLLVGMMVILVIQIKGMKGTSLGARYLKMLMILFVLQSIFYGIQIVTTPIYAILIPMALHKKQ